MLFSSVLPADCLTWALTFCIGLLAYILGAAQYRPAPATDENGKHSEEEALDVSSRSALQEPSLAAVRTKTLGDQISTDAERAPQTPAVSLNPSSGNGEESEEHSEDGEVEERNGGMTVATETKATADTNVEVQDNTEPKAVTKRAVTRRKIAPRQVCELAVVQFRDTKESKVVTTCDGGIRDGQDRSAFKTDEREKGVDKGRTALTERKMGARVGGTRPSDVPLSLSRTRITSDGIPIVDIRTVAASSAVNELDGKVGVAVGAGGQKVREIKSRRGPASAPTVGSKSPSRTNSNASERERASVVYRSPSSPLSPKAADYTPHGHKRPGPTHLSDRGAYVSSGGQKCGYSPVFGNQRQQHQYSTVMGHKAGGMMEEGNAAPGADFLLGDQIPARNGVETSPISTISNISPTASPMHRRNESENTKLESAWMMASMAAAELGIGESDHLDSSQKDGRNTKKDPGGNAVFGGQTPWGAPSAAADPLPSGSDPSHLSNHVSNSFSDAERSNKDSANYGLDLYSSLSSLSWASNSLSSFGSSLHRTTSATDRTDVFDTIKGIWGEHSDEDKVGVSSIDR